MALHFGDFNLIGQEFAGTFHAVYKANPDNLDKVILALKVSGASAIQSVSLLVSELGLTLSEADDLVVNSPAWKERKAATEQLRDEFGDYLESLD